jgi:prophage regulatory protein
MRIIRKPDVEAKTGLRRSKIDILEKRGEFPKRVKITEYAVGWVESEVDTWLEQRVARSREPQHQDKAA